MIKVGKAYIIFPAGFNLSKEAHNAYFEQSLLKEKLNEELRTKDARSIIQIHLKYVHAFEKFIKLITLDNISKLSSSEFDSYLYDVTKEVGNLSEAVQYAYSRKDSIGEELFQMLNILDALTFKLKYGDYKSEFKELLKDAKKGISQQWLRPLVLWEKEGKSTEEMVDLTQLRIRELHSEYISALEDYTGLAVVESVSNPGILYYCQCIWPPYNPPTGGYFYKPFKCGKVWVGIYDSPEPRSNRMIGQFCTSVYTTSLDYYWNEALERRPNAKSIQVKWFYHSKYQEDGRKHNLIWEGNKNTTRAWYTYETYDTTSPPAGNYAFSNYRSALTCCSPSLWECHYCNTHCYSCFCCDDDRTQHFVIRQP